VVRLLLFLGSPVRDSGCHLTMAGCQTHFERRLRGQRQHEVLQAIAQVIVVVLVYHPLANVPSEQLQRLCCGLRFSDLPIARSKDGTLAFRVRRKERW
jgi:hypothetical protein